MHACETQQNTREFEGKEFTWGAATYWVVGAAVTYCVVAAGAAVTYWVVAGAAAYVYCSVWMQLTFNPCMICMDHGITGTQGRRGIVWYEWTGRQEHDYVLSSCSWTYIVCLKAAGYVLLVWARTYTVFTTCVKACARACIVVVHTCGLCRQKPKNKVQACSSHTAGHVYKAGRRRDKVLYYLGGRRSNILSGGSRNVLGGCGSGHVLGGGSCGGHVLQFGKNDARTHIQGELSNFQNLEESMQESWGGTGDQWGKQENHTRGSVCDQVRMYDHMCGVVVHMCWLGICEPIKN